ncbi:pitrilysin family protein [Quadrisphaera sp. DSM 44207]|uniref:M16 family metallopeptidase n=1 Tax=Quadrisphaera sp. DSM 44207 TaxID=1881057 RepID=UPI000885AC56|nr:pitrilysin family protein [Quadrisphaera sp. DSM 44207]SDQ77064.1 Predicted Zn-dependent peptidase [Quadrisphaera sp. DSM 44207]
MAAVPLPLTGTDGTRTLSGEDAGALVRRSVLPGGVRVLTEAVPGMRSVTVGAWVGVGSRDEASGHHGSTHFLEHLLFKGTARRTAMDIAAAFDAVGGESNAATGKEHTTYYARVLDADLPMAIDVIGDMVTSATITEEDVASERGVILEELAMNDDDPTDVAHERFAEQVFGEGTPLGRPIGGTAQSILDVPRDAVLAHYRQHYTAPGIVVTAAGGLEHEAVCALVREALGRAGWDLAEGARPLPRRSSALQVPPPAAGGVLTVERPTEQANVLLGGLGVPAADPRRHALAVLNAVLGGGMSSRLFQEVREKRGLAYSVYSFGAGYADAGYFGLYAGCAPAKTAQVVQLLAEQWQLLATDGVGREELERAVGQVRGGTVLALEDSSARMSRLGKAELVHGEWLSVEAALARTAAVTADDVQALAAALWEQPHHLTVVGPFDADPVPTAP